MILSFRQPDCLEAYSLLDRSFASLAFARFALSEETTFSSNRDTVPMEGSRTVMLTVLARSAARRPEELWIVDFRFWIYD